jgi:hypothetical protein
MARKKKETKWIEVKYLEGGDGPAVVEFDGDVEVPFLSHPDPLLVMIIEDEVGVYTKWIPLDGPISDFNIKAISSLLREEWSDYLAEDQEMYSEDHGDMLDEKRIEENRKRHEEEKALGIR